MPAPRFAPAFKLINAFSRFSPTRPLHTLWRQTGHQLRPPRPEPFASFVGNAQASVIATGQAELVSAATILCEERRGPTPTIVLGGFVPDATEQVYLLRGLLLKHGSVYYVNYARTGFSTELICAQLDDLVEELDARHGQCPVIFGVSFGAGLVLEWLRRRSSQGRPVDLKGCILVSPVACVEDLIDPNEPKPTTLLGRAIRPYLAQRDADLVGVEKSRDVFVKMFEAGAKNKTALRHLLTRSELQRLRDAVINTIRGIDRQGACQRMQSLKQMFSPLRYFSETVLPLCTAPTLILYAEKESSVIVENAPTRRAFETQRRAYFPDSQLRVIINSEGNPVQHASLLFHFFNFRPVLSAFYRGLKLGKQSQAA